MATEIGPLIIAVLTVLVISDGADAYGQSSNLGGDRVLLAEAGSRARRRRARRSPPPSEPATNDQAAGATDAPAAPGPEEADESPAA